MEFDMKASKKKSVGEWSKTWNDLATRLWDLPQEDPEHTELSDNIMALRAGLQKYFEGDNCRPICITMNVVDYGLWRMPI